MIFVLSVSIFCASPHGHFPHVEPLQASEILRPLLMEVVSYADIVCGQFQLQIVRLIANIHIVEPLKGSTVS